MGALPQCPGCPISTKCPWNELTQHFSKREAGCRAGVWYWASADAAGSCGGVSTLTVDSSGTSRSCWASSAAARFGDARTTEFVHFLMKSKLCAHSRIIALPFSFMEEVSSSLFSLWKRIRGKITLHLHEGTSAARWYLVRAKQMSHLSDVFSHFSFADSCSYLPRTKKQKHPVGAIQGLAGGWPSTPFDGIKSIAF